MGMHLGEEYAISSSPESDSVTWRSFRAVVQISGGPRSGDQCSAYQVQRCGPAGGKKPERPSVLRSSGLFGARPWGLLEGSEPRPLPAWTSRAARPLAQTAVSKVCWSPRSRLAHLCNRGGSTRSIPGPPTRFKSGANGTRLSCATEQRPRLDHSKWADVFDAEGWLNSFPISTASEALPAFWIHSVAAARHAGAGCIDRVVM